MIDSAQWWLYEQTSFRQLSEIYRAEEFMGPREAHVQNEKEPTSPLFFMPILYSELLPLQPLGCPLWVVMLRSLTSPSREDWMPLNHATLLWEAWGMQSDRQEELSESVMWGGGGGWRLSVVCHLLKSDPTEGWLVSSALDFCAAGQVIGRIGWI